MGAGEHILDALVDAMNGLTGWRRSPRPPGAWWQDGTTLENKTWQVEISSLAIAESRARTSTQGGVNDGNLGCAAQTEVRIRWVWRIRSDKPHDDYRAAIASRTTVLVAACGASPVGIGPLIPIGVQQDVVALDGQQILLQTATLAVRHIQPVQG